jgi:hypothetical protein
MSAHTSRPTVDPLYVAARSVLLDALIALQPHGLSVIVAGAQAIYLRTGDANLAIAPYTTDGDLALDPAKLAGTPTLEAAMRTANFELSTEPGIWLATIRVGQEDVLIPVDLIVPEGVATGTGRRDARLQGQGERVARRALGLEAALVDHSTLTIHALSPDDRRSIQAEVAEPTALLIAKLHKLHERIASQRQTRIDDKDAADVLRIMQTTNPADIANTRHPHPRPDRQHTDHCRAHLPGCALWSARTPRHHDGPACPTNSNATRADTGTLRQLRSRHPRSRTAELTPHWSGLGSPRSSASARGISTRRSPTSR